tara:strand:- start:38 stop:2332 length:2295 start_codon:yes stop_codon:yes gene_type:complete
MSFLVRERLEDAAEHLKEIVTAKSVGKGSQYNAVVRSVAKHDDATNTGDYLKLTYIGLKAVLKALQVKEKNTLLKVTLDIGSRIEADLKCQMFEASYPAYYDTVRKSFAEQNVTDYVHKHKVMMKKFGDFEIEWAEWLPTEKVQLGMRVLRALLGVYGDVIFTYMEVNRGKRLYRLDTTPDFDIWAAEFEKERGLLNPMYLPLKAPPRPWESLTNGGYHTIDLRMKFIKTKGKDHRAYVKENIPTQHLTAVNKMQRTAWQINSRVLEVQKEIYQRGLGIGMPSNEKITPPDFPEHLKTIEKVDLTEDQHEEVKEWKMVAKSCYGREQQRKGQILAFMQSHKLAKELCTWDKLYFVYTCDFRGRIYCATAGLSPQGADQAKGLLRFANKVKLGVDGVKWLAIHGANTFGNDKLSYEGRVAWIQEQEHFIRQIVSDPISYREWGDADKPYQFLAFCYEWADCDYGRNPNAEGQLPVGLDGSCNGLQHFSAMLRDEIGAKATNLTASNKPEDIYQEVANLVKEKLEAMDDPRARKWLKVGIDRKCAKRPVMTLPYGATQTSARVYILEYVSDNWAKFELEEIHKWEYAKFLTPILWKSIGEIVIAARGAMDWLQSNTKSGYIQWLTPLGFPVYQYYKDVPHQRVSTQLDGAIMLQLRDFNRDGTPNRTQQRNGIAPNFVHSIDSTHMVLTVNHTKLDSYAMIHDDFGTHAGNTEELFVAIRSTFKHLYTEYDPLVDWAEQVGVDVETIPEIGTYDINDITDADYFFG